MSDWEPVGSNGWQTVGKSDDGWETIGQSKPQESAGVGVGIKSNMASVANMVDTTGVALWSRLASVLGNEKRADEMMEELGYRRKGREMWANPEGKPLDFTDKLVGALANLPAGILTAGLSPADTAYRAMEAGETEGKAKKAAMIDAFGNAIGMLPMGSTLGTVGKTAWTGITNAGQEHFTKMAISGYLDTEKGKEQFQPTLEDTTIAGLLGVGGGVVHGLESRSAMKREAAKVKLAEEKLKAKTEKVAEDAEITKRKANLTDQLILQRLKEIHKEETRRQATEGTRTEGTEPIYVDPQEQAFRGDPQEPGARLGYDRGSDAMEVAADTGDFGKPGEPLPQLQKGEYSVSDAELAAKAQLMRMGANPNPEITPTNAQLHDQRIVDRLRELNTPQEQPRPQMPSGLEPTNNGPRPQGQGMRPMTGGVSNRPTVMNQGWRRRQGGGISTDLLDLPYRFLGLERLPNSKVISSEMLRGVLGQADLNQMEKDALQTAFNNVATDGKAARADLIQEMRNVTAPHNLSRKELQGYESYADYGLEGIYRENVPTARTNLQLLNEPMTRANHFDEPNLMGWTRSFMEYGTRHVVEIQSDLAQKLKPLDQERLAKLKETVDSLEDQIDIYYELNYNSGKLDEPDWVAENLRKLNEINPDAIMMLEDELKAAGYKVTEDQLFNGTWTPNAPLVYALHDAFRSTQWDLYSLATEQRAALYTARDSEKLAKNKQTGALKNWPVRLIREELKKAAENGEKSVRFATADTIAQVEHWPVHQYDVEVSNLENTIKRLRDVEDPNTLSFLEDAAYYQQTVQALEKAKANLEKYGPGDHLSPEHQGIYNRYKKEIEKYLTSIGGKPYTDQFGVDWIEVPVEKHRSRPIMYGQRGAINVEAIREGFEKLRTGVNTPREYLKSFGGTFDPFQWKKLLEDIDDPKSRRTVALMSPEEFHRLAAPRADWQYEEAGAKHADIREGLSSENGLRSIPYLEVRMENGIAKVTGHEGRHRMDVFKHKNIPLVPVEIRAANYRWGEGQGDYLNSEDFPTKIRPENTNSSAYDRPMPDVLHTKSKETEKYIPASQRGGVNVDAVSDFFKKGPLAKTIEKANKKATTIAPDPNPDEIIAKAKTEQDNRGKGGDSRLGDVTRAATRSNTYTESGYISAAKKRQSSLIMGVGDIVTNVTKRSEFNERQHVFPAEQAVKRLSMEEMTGLSKLMLLEGTHKATLTTKEMAEAGYSLKQITAYQYLRNMYDAAWKVQNEARIAKGQSPLTKLDWYVSARWEGDFRLPIYDKNEKLVWYLAADSKWGIRDQVNSLKEKFPDLVYDMKKLEPVRYRNRKTDFEAAYPTILDLLGTNDPAVAAIKQYMDDITQGRAEGFLSQQKHFLDKTGVRGFTGDRPGFNEKKDALRMFEQQIRYAKNAFKWTEMQKASDSLKKILNDPELNKTQPNNINYAREYVKNAMGFGESQAIRQLGDLWLKAGISPNYLKDFTSDLKSFFILEKLAANVGYTVANLIQTSYMLPHLALLNAHGYKANPVKALSVGMSLGTIMGMGHYANYYGIKKNQIPNMDFFNAAYKYAEENGVTSRSIFDEAPVGSGFSASGKIANIASKTMTTPETLVRSFAFMTYAQYLKDSGKFKTDAEVFKKAEEITHLSMVDYRATERPLMFEKLGTMGNMLNTLQTFTFSYYNNLSLFTREALNGNPAAFMTFIGMQFMLSGMMGLPIADDTYKLYMWLKNQLPTGVWAKMQKNDFLSDPKLWTMDKVGNSSLNQFINNGIELMTGKPGSYNVGNAIVNGPVSETTGVALQSRLAAAGVGQMGQTPLGPMTDAYRQIKDATSFAMNPNDPTKFAQMLMSSSPVGVQGALETSDLMRKQTYAEGTDPRTGERRRTYGRNTDLADNRGEYYRYPDRPVKAAGITTTDENLRRWTGLRTSDEQMRKDMGYTLNNTNKQIQERAREVTEQFMNAMKDGNKAKMEELQRLHIELTDQPINDQQVEAAIKKKNLDAITKAKIGANTVEKIIEMGRIDRVLKDNR